MVGWKGEKRLCLNRPAWATHCCYLLLPPVIRFLGMARWSFFTALVINGAESFPSWLCYDMVAGSVAPCPQPSLGPCRVPSRCEWSTFTPTFSQSLCPLRCDKLPPRLSAAPPHTCLAYGPIGCHPARGPRAVPAFHSLNVPGDGPSAQISRVYSIVQVLV